MRILSTSVAAGLAALTLAGITMTRDADAQDRRWNPVGNCQDPIEGAATSQGILGLGSARARAAAQSNWEINVEDKYGPEFADFRFARNVQWDCKKGAILKAKCTVIARPCR